MPLFKQDDKFLAAMISHAGLHKSGFDTEGLIAIAQTAFWASISREEGRSVTGQLRIAGESEGLGSIRLESPLPLEPEPLVKLFTACPKACLLVNQGAHGNAHVWGFETPVAKDSPLPRLKVLGHALLALISGRHVVAVHDRGKSFTPDAGIMEFVRKVVQEGFDDAVQAAERKLRTNAFVHLASTMLGHGHGGTIIVASSQDAGWEQDVHIRYKIHPNSIRALSESAAAASDILELLESEMSQSQTRSRAAGERPAEAKFIERLRDIGHLTAVDGAVIIQRSLTLRGFGAKLTPPLSPEGLLTLDALTGAESAIEVEALGGTRHQSAALFVQAHRHALAVVASQDGRLTVSTLTIEAGCMQFRTSSTRCGSTIRLIDRDSFGWWRKSRPPATPFAGDIP